MKPAHISFAIIWSVLLLLTAAAPAFAGNVVILGAQIDAAGTHLTLTRLIRRGLDFGLADVA
jgi:hypothetical protein